MKKQMNIIVEQNPTILVRIIQLVKRNRINICKLTAEDIIDNEAFISVILDLPEEQVVSLKRKIDRFVDVRTVEYVAT